MIDRLLIGCLAGVLMHAGAVQAQQVWRCGPEGRSYTDRPCGGGTNLDTIEPRPAADVRSALSRSQRDTALAESLRQDRLQREAPMASRPTRVPKAKATSTVERPAPEAASRRPAGLRAKPLKPPADDGTFRATVPGSRRTQG